MVKYSVKITESCIMYLEIDAKDHADLKDQIRDRIERYDYDQEEDGGMDVEDIRIGPLSDTFGVEANIPF